MSSYSLLRGVPRNISACLICFRMKFEHSAFVMEAIGLVVVALELVVEETWRCGACRLFVPSETKQYLQLAKLSSKTIEYAFDWRAVCFLFIRLSMKRRNVVESVRRRGVERIIEGRLIVNTRKILVLETSKSQQKYTKGTLKPISFWKNWKSCLALVVLLALLLIFTAISIRFKQIRQKRYLYLIH